jgi:hypothetical protein
LPRDTVEAALRGTATYPHTGVAAHRHARGQTFFSWRNRIMALPQARDGAYFIGPESDTLLGRPVVRGCPESHRLQSIEVFRRDNGFAAALVMDRCQDSLRQEVLFASLPDGRILVWERFAALRSVAVESLDQGVLAIVNEQSPVLRDACPGHRTLYGPGFERRYESRVETSPDADIVERFGHPAWLNVDDRLGIRLKAAGAALYHNRAFHKPFYAVKDNLVLSRIEAPREMRSGETAAWMAALLTLEESRKETADETFKVLDGPPDAAALSSGAHLAAANFASKDREIAFSFDASRGAPLFAGTRCFCDGSAARIILELPANGAAFLKRIGHVPAGRTAAYECTASGRVIESTNSEGKDDCHGQARNSE